MDAASSHGADGLQEELFERHRASIARATLGIDPVVFNGEPVVRVGLEVFQVAELDGLLVRRQVVQDSKQTVEGCIRCF